MVVDSAMKHTMFVRANYRTTTRRGRLSFPGTPANSAYSEQSKGLAVGLNSVLTPNFVSTFRYGLTHQSLDNPGISRTPQVVFRTMFVLLRH